MSETHVRCRKCRTKLILPEEKDCLTTCHGPSDSQGKDNSECLLDKSILYVKDEKLPVWLETLVQTVSRTLNNILQTHEE
jgi:hypothetical protein